jgi:hypothetical protein
LQRHEVEERRIYHETRCQQERRLIREARCARSAVAHAHLFSLHRLMTIDLLVPEAEADDLTRINPE